MNRQPSLLASSAAGRPLPRNYKTEIMQYGGGPGSGNNNPQQQRLFNMMMQQQQHMAAAAAAAAGGGHHHPHHHPHHLHHHPAGIYGHTGGAGIPGGAAGSFPGGVSPSSLAQVHAARQARLAPPSHAQAQPQGPPMMATFVTRLSENDVLLGRGTPCAENEGNVRFRRLVKQRKMEYIAAEKRMRKDAIAREILEVIAARGGKFLRKVESQAEMEQLGVPPGFHNSKEVWAIVDEDTQVQKVKQALRNKDDAAELMMQAQQQAQAQQAEDEEAAAESEANKEEDDEDVANTTASNDGEGTTTTSTKSSSKKYGEQDVTNRFPRGVLDETNILKADCSLYGTGVLDRDCSSSEEGEGKVGSPKHKKSSDSDLMKKKVIAGGMKSPGSKSPTKKMVSSSTMMDDADLIAVQAANRRASMGAFSGADASSLITPGNRRSLSTTLRLDPTMAGLTPPPAQPQSSAGMMRSSRQLWDQSQAAPNERDLRTIQELKRIKLMREQMAAVNPHHSTTGGMMNPSAALAAAGLGSPGLAPAVDGGPYVGGGAMGGATDPQFMMNAEYRQMQQAAQMEHQMAAAAACREQAAMAASLHLPRSSFSAAADMTQTSAAALTARQIQLEAAAAAQSQRRASSLPHQEAMMDFPPRSTIGNTTAATATVRPQRAGADSAGERAIGIAQAMKRAEAFSPTESLEMSHIETLILTVLCSHGLPVWTPEAHTKSFVALPTFAKRLDWTWYGFASILKQKASSSHHNTKKKALASGDSGSTANSPRVEELALEAAMEYQRDPRELATKTIMLMEKLRRHCDTCGSSSSSQRKSPGGGLGMRVPLWLDRELSRWAMTLGIADPTGRPVPFSSTDFIAEHNEYREDPSIVATAAFDPPLADDVVEQVALLTRLRSVFVKNKGREIRSKLEGATQKTGSSSIEGWEDLSKGWEGESQGLRDLLLCDRLLSEGFSGVLLSTDDLGTEYQLGVNPQQFPSFESMGLAKSSIQQRANQITRELHVMEEQKDLQCLRLDRMERLAQSVLQSQQPDGRREGGGGALTNLTSGPAKKRRGSVLVGGGSGSRSGSPVDPSGASAKKQKTSRQ